jgi:hypothetical protein
LFRETPEFIKSINSELEPVLWLFVSKITTANAVKLVRLSIKSSRIGY